MREAAIHAWEKDGKPYLITSLPYFSRAALTASVVDANITPGVNTALAVFAPQEVTFFNYAKADTRQDLGIQATESDTNLSQRRETNSNSDFVIEAISGFMANAYVGYSQAVIDALPSPVANPFAQQYLLGRLPGRDPGSIYRPAQVNSPFNLQQELQSQLGPHTSLTIRSDDNSIQQIANLGNIGQGSGASYLLANGEPSPENRFRIPEGIIWRREGAGSDTKITFTAKLTKTVVVPLSLVVPPASGDGAGIVPESIKADWQLNLHGIQLREGSRNY